MPDHLLVDRADRVLTLTLDRPAKKNALTGAMYGALTEALAGAADDADVRAVVLTGAGGVFTAGNDLGDFLMDPPAGPESTVFQFLQAVSTFPKPLLAAVEGPAIGIGTTVLLHCDFAYAAPSATFKMPFVDLGLVPEAASSLLVPRLAGPARASELLILGRSFSAETAREIGLVNAVADDPLAAAQATAREVARKAPEAVRLTKALLKRSTADAVGETIGREGALFVERLGSPEAQEAFAAFFEKRAPEF